jgi:DNA repair exonuclease SbcCD ATPase subunit
MNRHRLKLEQLKGEKTNIEKSLLQLRMTLRTKRKELVKHEQAREVIREVGIKTQQQLQYHISTITSLALETVFDNPYSLELDFVQRRNKTECDIYFSRDGARVEPLTASGGGAVDVATFALRIACWSLETPHSRNVIILDEPMKYVSENLRDKVSSMLKEISQKLGIQFIIITHDPKLTSYADKVFEVSINKKGISKV